MSAMHSQSIKSISSEHGASDALSLRRARRPRPATEKRRLQNRESQRTYREKQKRLIEELRQTAVSSTANTQMVQTSRRPLQAKPTGLSFGSTPCLEISDERSNGEVQESTRTEDLYSSENSETVPIPQPPRHGGSQQTWGPNGFDYNLLDESSITYADTSWKSVSSLITNTAQSPMDLNMQPTHPGQELYDFSLPSFFEDTITIPATNTAQVDPTSASNNRHISSWPGNIASRTTFTAPSTPMEHHDALSPLLSYMSSTNQISASNIGSLNLLQVNDSLENRNLLKSALDQNHTIGSIFLAGLRSISNHPNLAPPVPDIYANHMSLRRLSTLQAYLSNANALSFHLPSLMHSDASSPFYMPDITTLRAATSYISTLPASYPPHLRPTPPQILYPHLPFIDLLPFPTLRARAITMTNVTPPLLDLMELKIDILRDGLICWGGKNAKGGEGQPWDMRTWEAAGWFLTKWCILVGDETDEVREGSNWWRRLRGKEAGGRFDEIV